MAAAIKWKRSTEGYVESHDGRFEIEPVFMGRTTAQAFHLYRRPVAGGPREKVESYLPTQRDAKDRAEVL